MTAKSSWKQSDEMTMRNSCTSRQRSIAELSIHIFHLRLETQCLYKNTVFHAASVRKEDAETDTSLHFALLQSPSSRSLDYHSYYCQWEQVNSKWEWNTISPDACGKRRHIPLTEDSSISTVVIMATERTNVVRRQTLAEHFNKRRDKRLLWHTERDSQPKYTVQAAFQWKKWNQARM